jgi:rhodanese-related sulfurtransferase
MFQRLCQTISAPFFGGDSVKMDFSQVQEGLAENSIFLIDVRNRDEVQKLGKIPGSQNLPRK